MRLRLNYHVHGVGSTAEKADIQLIKKCTIRNITDRILRDVNIFN